MSTVQACNYVFTGQRVSGMDQLKGLKIAHVYHDSDYGQETLPMLYTQARGSCGMPRDVLHRGTVEATRGRGDCRSRS